MIRSQRFQVLQQISKQEKETTMFFEKQKKLSGVNNSSSFTHVHWPSLATCMGSDQLP